MEGYYVRKFSGAYFYFLQSLGNKNHQIGIKYDCYYPNTEIKGQEIGNAGNNLNAANIKYNTLGIGYLYYMTENVKLTLWYDKITNEKTKLVGFTEGLADDVFTFRLQFRF